MEVADDPGVRLHEHGRAVAHPLGDLDRALALVEPQRRGAVVEVVRASDVDASVAHRLREAPGAEVLEVVGAPRLPVGAGEDGITVLASGRLAPGLDVGG